MSAQRWKRSAARRHEISAVVTAVKGKRRTSAARPQLRFLLSLVHFCFFPLCRHLFLMRRWDTPKKCQHVSVAGCFCASVSRCPDDSMFQTSWLLGQFFLETRSHARVAWPGLLWLTTTNLEKASLVFSEVRHPPKNQFLRSVRPSSVAALTTRSFVAKK